ncbi:vWA domain-containing protein [Occultella gossypii]|uniref:VWA domain-containing protein n=1 Tax=Occultella gossypii TaxID=2800820 RepID=A0ABS7SAC4_9MICO|nr:VWA domain-containing protein [Occultella gossypii]MBZ2197298.1 VWA domain-containing protein [Occultella gossypii]
MTVSILWGWLIPVLLVAIAAGAWWWWRRTAARTSADAVRVAHSERLTSLPRYRALAARRRQLLTAMTVAVVGLAVAGTVLLARPIGASATEPELHTRDIMLCLDVSGSMDSFNEELLATFAELVPQFEGERIGMTMWDSSAVTVFPLTTDYAYVTEQLTMLSQGFAENDFAQLRGTYYGEGGSSLIGDGLVSCALRFDAVDTDRSRSIIMATDNYVSGNPLVTLPEAARLVADRDIRLYALNVTSWGESDESLELAEAAELTGGSSYLIEEPEEIAALVNTIADSEAAAFTGAPQVLEYAAPGVFLALGGAGLVALMGLAWKAGL